MKNGNSDLIKIAERLHLELSNYNGNDKSIIELKESVTDLLNEIRSGNIITQYDEDRVPGVYQWKNHGMGWPDAIKNSYFEFRQALSGGRSKGVEEFLKRVEKDGKL